MLLKQIKTDTFFSIFLQLSRSDATQLTLKKVDLNMTAKYSCEVTVDFPEFTTELRAAILYVVGKLNIYHFVLIILF